MRALDFSSSWTGKKCEYVKGKCKHFTPKFQVYTACSKSIGGFRCAFVTDDANARLYMYVLVCDEKFHQIEEKWSKFSHIELSITL